LGVASAATQPWLLWQRNPLTIPLTMNITNIYADTNGGVEITLADADAIQLGAGSGTETNTALIADLQVRHEYTLSIISTNLSSMNIYFAWKANWVPIGRSGRASRPKIYQLFIDRQNEGTNISVSGGSGVYSNTWTVELTENLPVNWRQEDGSDDPSFAPGDGIWAQIGPGKSLAPSMGAISWSVSLGRLMDGLAAGRLTLREAQITPSIFTPTNIYYTAGSQIVRDQVNLITLNSDSPVIRQVQVCQCFVDIVPLTNSTEMRFYHTNQIGLQINGFGWFTNISGSPYVVWALVNPAPPNTN
jgi:hypothetical protein